MKLSTRQSLILNYLNEYPGTTIKQLAHHFDVTTQTIKSALVSLEDILKSYEMGLEILPGNKIKLTKGENLPLLLKSAEIFIEFPLTSQILLVLLLHKDFLTLQEIADKLYVSKSLIEKQMTELLKQYKEMIQSVRHYGIKYSATEFKRRELFVKLVTPYLQGINFSESLQSFSDLHFPLDSYFKEEEMEEAISLISYIQCIESIGFTDEAIQQLFLYLLFMIHAKANGAEEIEESFVEIANKLHNFNQYMDMVSEINEKYELYFSPNEKYYLCYLFLILKKQKFLDRDAIIEYMSPFITQILDQIKGELLVDLLEDQQLKEGLALHIYTTLCKKDDCEQPESHYGWKEIKQQYPFGFEMATMTAHLLQEKYDYVATDDELIYLSLHFQAALERMRNNEEKIRAIIVCHLGIAAANLIIARLERLYKEIDIIGSYSVQKFEQLEDLDCELIISTEKLNCENKEIIYVSPVIKPYEMKHLTSFIKQRKTKSMFEKLVKEAIFLDLKKADTRTSVIEQMIQCLEKAKCVDEEYFESVCKRESISSTGINTVAVPHGKAIYVLKDKLCIARLEEPVNWDGSKVSYVFLFAFMNELLEENPSLFSSFYRRIARVDAENLLEPIHKASEEVFKKEFIKLLYE